MSGANCLTKAIWSRKERLASNRSEGEAGTLLDSEHQQVSKSAQKWATYGWKQHGKVVWATFIPSSLQEGSVTTPGPFTNLHLAGLCYPSVRQHIPVCSSWLPHGILCKCFPFTVSLNVIQMSWICCLQKSSSESGIKTCLHLRVCSSPTSAKTGVVAVSVYCWQSGCTFNPEPPSHLLLCTRGVVVAGVNSSATGRMWCIYIFGVCHCPCNHI